MALLGKGRRAATIYTTCRDVPSSCEGRSGPSSDDGVGAAGHLGGRRVLKRFNGAERSRLAVVGDGRLGGFRQTCSRC